MIQSQPSLGGDPGQEIEVRVYLWRWCTTWWPTSELYSWLKGMSRLTYAQAN
jgi:hypothetical protein